MCKRINVIRLKINNKHKFSSTKNDNEKNNNKAPWNRNELTICGVTWSGGKTLKQKYYGACKNQRNDCPSYGQLANENI